VLLDRATLRATVERLGAEISADHPDGVVLIGVLKGSLIFLADLARAITGIDVTIDFLAISRYAPDSGRVKLLKDLDLDITGRDVVLVEDMVDTGLTLAYLLHQVGERAPRRVEVCTLLDRPVRRIVPQTARYVGREIPDVFALGYGLHHADLYRNVPFVVAVDPKVLARRPDAYVADLYGPGAIESPDARQERQKAGGRVNSPDASGGSA
jgi:hypoxanthine phosphoribosyltransferase